MTMHCVGQKESELKYQKECPQAGLNNRPHHVTLRIPQYEWRALPLSYKGLWKFSYYKHYIAFDCTRSSTGTSILEHVELCSAKTCSSRCAWSARHSCFDTYAYNFRRSHWVARMLSPAAISCQNAQLVLRTRTDPTWSPQVREVCHTLSAIFSL